MITPGVLRAVPWLTLLLMAGPVAAGLAGTLMPVIGTDAFARLWAWPGLAGAVRLSAGTGIVATALSLGIALITVAALQGGRAFGVIVRLLSPLLALPHAAAALGLAFLIAPSGWIARALSPWATGWAVPPDALILNDPSGLALILGLVVKEVPFLLLMVLAALPQADAPRRLMLTASLGYGRVAGWFLAVLPAVWPQIRLPVCAVLAYAMTNVDMALILGPGLPPTLSAQVVLWLMHPDPVWHAPAAAGALVQLGLVAGVLGLCLAAERAVSAGGLRLAVGGRRLPGLDRVAGPLALGLAMGVFGLVAGGMAGLGVWSVAGPWSFPDALPDGLTVKTWARAAPGLWGATAATLALGGLATGIAVALVLGCLEAEARFGLRPGAGAMGLLYLPLVVPQVAFLPGLQALSLASGADGTIWAVAAAHLVFVLPYVFLSLAAPFRAWDARIGLAGAALGAGPARVFWRLRLPMLMAPVMTAAAVGFAVSVGQYLPTLALGAGRITTLTTEAVALSSGGNRRVIGTYAMVQTALPALGFAFALALPALVFARRRGMRGPA